MLLSEKGVQLNGDNVDYFIRNGQIGWAIVALIVGGPASWKFFDYVGKFFSRRFDNRDEMLKQMLDSQAREMDIRLAEAQSRTAIANALTDSAKAHIEAAKAHAAQSDAIVELARSVGAGK